MTFGLAAAECANLVLQGAAVARRSHDHDLVARGEGFGGVEELTDRVLGDEPGDDQDVLTVLETVRNRVRGRGCRRRTE